MADNPFAKYAGPQQSDNPFAKYGQTFSDAEIPGSFGRTIGLDARSVVHALSAVPQMVMNAEGGLYNAGANMVQGYHAPDEANGPFRFRSAGQNADQLMTKAGLPQPQNGEERLLSDVVSGVSGVGGSLGIARGLQALQKPVTQAVGRALASNPVKQAIGGATGGLAAGGAREAGAPVPVQMAAGLAGGAAPFGVSGAVSQLKPGKIAAPSISSLKDVSRQHYQNLDNSGVQVSNDALNALGDSAVDRFGERLDPTLHPEATAAYNRVTQFGTDGKLGDAPTTFTKLDNLRRVVADAAQSIKPADKAMARQILDHVDNFVNRLGPQDLDTTALDAARANAMTATGNKGQIAKQISDIEKYKSGALAARGAAGAGTRNRYMSLRDDLQGAEADRQTALNEFNSENQQLATGAQDAIGNLKTARDLWSRAAKAQTIQNLIDKAGVNGSNYTASGLENSLRVQFRKLANNDRGMSRFSPQEQNAIRLVATGGSPASLNNALRYLGKFSPQGFFPAVTEMVGVAHFGPIALAVPAAGFAGRVGATAMTKAAAERAVAIAARGRNAPPLPVSAPMGAAGLIPQQLNINSSIFRNNQ